MTVTFPPNWKRLAVSCHPGHWPVVDACVGMMAWTPPHSAILIQGLCFGEECRLEDSRVQIHYLLKSWVGVRQCFPSIVGFQVEMDPHHHCNAAHRERLSELSHIRCVLREMEAIPEERMLLLLEMQLWHSLVLPWESLMIRSTGYLQLIQQDLLSLSFSSRHLWRHWQRMLDYYPALLLVSSEACCQASSAALGA